MTDSPTPTQQTDGDGKRNMTPPSPHLDAGKPSHESTHGSDPSAPTQQQEGSQEAARDEQPTAGPAVWGFTTVGLFLFFLSHGRDMFVFPGAFLLGVFTWGALFGVPARIFNRNRMRRSLTTVAVLFFLAAALDVLEKYHSEVVYSANPPPKVDFTAPRLDTGAATADRENAAKIIDPETGEAYSADNPFAALIRGRPADIPDVRMYLKSDERGYLHGTVHNDTGKRFDKLKLSIETERWKRVHEVHVWVEPNTTKNFEVYVADALLDVKSFRVLSVTSTPGLIGGK